MRIVALGGSGAMGRSALSILAEETTVDEVVVADLNLEAATTVAAELAAKGQRATVQRVDVTDGAQLRAVLADADLVMNAVGPYYRFGVPTLRAAIETGTRYIDICDDAQPTVDMLALHAEAKAAGITGIIGAGASPGVMNFFAQIAAEGLDHVHDIVVGWTLNSAHYKWDMAASSGAGGGAAEMHFFEQFVRTVPVRSRGEVVPRRTREPIAFEIPGLGTGTGYVVGHPEPVTLPTTLDAYGDSVSVCLGTSDRIAALDLLASKLEDDTLSMEQLMAGPWPSSPEAAVHEHVRYPDGGDLPIYFTLVTGVRDGAEVTQFVGCHCKPADMALSTGVPFALATAQALDAELAPGVFPLDGVLNRSPFLERVARRWNVAPEELYFRGSVAGKVPLHTRSQVS
jgi:lysine 6-dehydrogenase